MLHYCKTLWLCLLGLVPSGIRCVVLLSLLIGYVGLANANTVLVPKTGQTKCYSATGTEISCAGTGQDGEFQSGVTWPSPRFSNNGNATVTDQLTGLMWSYEPNLLGVYPSNYARVDQDGVANDGLVTWQHALDFIN